MRPPNAPSKTLTPSRSTHCINKPGSKQGMPGGGGGKTAPEVTFCHMPEHVVLTCVRLVILKKLGSRGFGQDRKVNMEKV